MTKKSDAPAIRFKGFSDAWEQRKLGDLLQTLPFKQFLKEPEPDGKYEIIQQGNEPVIGFANGTPCGDYKDVVIFGDHTLSLYKPQHPFFVATDGVRIVKGQQDTDGYYLLSLLERYKPQSEGYKRYYSILADTNCITTYNTSEQEKIGVFFKLLDNLITLHQRKFEKLTNVKKSMLEKMFPQNGSSYPEIRFKGFTDPWEQRKLGELVDRVVRKNTNNESTLPLTISAQYGLVDQITYFNNRVASRDVSNYYLVLNGEFAYNKSTSDGYPFGAVKRLDLYEKGVLSTLYIVFAPKKEQQIDSDYLTVFFDTDRWHKGVAERAAEGARNHGLLNISAEDFFDIDLSVPKDIVEQKQIGAFIRQLDNLITLHQRECISFTARAGRLILTANKKRNTSSWEQRKVGDLLIERNQQAPMSDDYPLMAFIANEGVAPKGERYDRSALVTDTVNKLYKKTEKGDFIYSSNNLETGSIGLNKYGKACISPVYSIFEPTGIADSDFLGRRLVRKDFINAMVKWRQGVIYGQWRIHESDFLKIEITVPSVEEQRKIGAYLDQLDNLITLHQRKPFLMKWRTSDANRNQTNRLVL